MEDHDVSVQWHECCIPKVPLLHQICLQILQESLNKYTAQLILPSRKQSNYRENATVFHTEFKILGTYPISGDSFWTYWWKHTFLRVPSLDDPVPSPSQICKTLKFKCLLAILCFYINTYRFLIWEQCAKIFRQLLHRFST